MFFTVIICLLFWIITFLWHKFSLQCSVYLREKFSEHKRQLHWMVYVFETILVIMVYLYAHQSKTFLYRYLRHMKMSSAYIWLIPVVMVFSLDIAFMQDINNNILKFLHSNNIFYLGHNRIQYYHATYLFWHSFYKSILFCSLFGYFLLSPLVIFNSYIIKKYLSMDIKLLSFWQISCALMIILLTLLLVSDFMSYRPLHQLQAEDPSYIDKSIRAECRYLLHFKLKHDFRKKNDSFTFVNYLRRILNTGKNVHSFTNLEGCTIIRISMDEFSSFYRNGFSRFSRGWTKVKGILNIVYYLSVLNDNNEFMTLSDSVDFFKNYLSIVLYNMYLKSPEFFKTKLLSPRKMGIEKRYQFNHYIIPDFIMFKKTDSSEYWCNINSIMVHNRFFKNCLSINIQTLTFKSDGYSQDVLEFFNQELSELINSEMRNMNRCFRQSNLDLNSVDKIITSLEKLFPNYFKEYLSSDLFKIEFGDDLSRKFVRYLRDQEININY